MSFSKQTWNSYKGWHLENGNGLVLSFMAMLHRTLSMCCTLKTWASMLQAIKHMLVVNLRLFAWGFLQITQKHTIGGFYVGTSEHKKRDSKGDRAPRDGGRCRKDHSFMPPHLLAPKGTVGMAGGSPVCIPLGTTHRWVQHQETLSSFWSWHGSCLCHPRDTMHSWSE